MLARGCRHQLITAVAIPHLPFVSSDSGVGPAAQLALRAFALGPDAVASFERRPGGPTTATPSHQIPAGVGLRRPSHPRGNASRQRGSRGRPSAPRLTGRIRECEIRSVRMRNKHDAEISLLPRPRGLSPSEGSRYAALLRCRCGRRQWRLASVFEGRLIRL